MTPLRPMRRPLGGLVAAALFLGACALEGQSGEAASLRGELVRNPDGTLDASVIAVGVPSVPDALWDRIVGSGRVGLYVPAASPAGDVLASRLADLLGESQVRRVLDVAALPPVGAEIEADGAVRLTWYRVPEAEGVSILADARAVEPEFSLRILILDSASDQEDWWGLQAALSQAGIRRVQILSGRP